MKTAGQGGDRPPRSARSSWPDAFATIVAGIGRSLTYRKPARAPARTAGDFHHALWHANSGLPTTQKTRWGLHPPWHPRKPCQIGFAQPQSSCRSVRSARPRASESTNTAPRAHELGTPAPPQPVPHAPVSHPQAVCESPERAQHHNRRSTHASAAPTRLLQETQFQTPAPLNPNTRVVQGRRGH